MTWKDILKASGLIDTKRFMEAFNGNYGQTIVATYANGQFEVAGEKLVDIDVKMTKLQGREIALEGDFELESGKKGNFEYTSEYAKTVSYPTKKRNPPIEAAKARDGLPTFRRGRTEIEVDGETTKLAMSSSLNELLTDIVNGVMQAYTEDYGDGRMSAVPRTDDDDGSGLDFGQGMKDRNYDPYAFRGGLREGFGSRKNKVESWKKVLGTRSIGGEEAEVTLELFRELQEAMKEYSNDERELALTKEEIQEYFPSIDLEKFADNERYVEEVLSDVPFRTAKFGNASEIYFTFYEVPNAKEGGFTVGRAKFGVFGTISNRVMDNPSIGQASQPDFPSFRRNSKLTNQEIGEATEDISDFLELTESELKSYFNRSQEGK